MSTLQIKCGSLDTFMWRLKLGSTAKLKQRSAAFLSLDFQNKVFPTYLEFPGAGVLLVFRTEAEANKACVVLCRNDPR